jgi:hypothetical protein
MVCTETAAHDVDVEIFELRGPVLHKAPLGTEASSQSGPPCGSRTIGKNSERSARNSCDRGARIDECRAARTVEQPVVHSDTGAYPCRSDRANVGRNVERNRQLDAQDGRWIWAPIVPPRCVSQPDLLYRGEVRAPPLHCLSLLSTSRQAAGAFRGLPGLL